MTHPDVRTIKITRDLCRVAFWLGVFLLGCALLML